MKLNPFLMLTSRRRFGLLVLAAVLFASALLILDSLASKSHPVAVAALNTDKEVHAQLGRLRFVVPVFFSYHSVTPPYKDCENRGYVTWSDRGLAFVAVSLRRQNMHRDPWEVYAIAVGYSNLPPKVSPGCVAEFKA